MRLLVLLTLITPPAIACDCLWQGSFSRAANKADLIIEATVQQHKGNSMDVSVNKVIRGHITMPTVRIWGDNGKTCRPKVEKFSDDSHWLLALYRIDEVPPGGFNPSTPNISFGRKGDYYLSACGAYWLALTEGWASGNLIGGTRWTYEDKQAGPVLLKLVTGYLDGNVSDATLQEASKPQPDARELMHDTQWFLHTQQAPPEKPAPQ